MSFLFGDLSPSPFSTNFLDQLRDAIAFAAEIAEADQEIANAGPRAAVLRGAANAELARIEGLATAMLAAAATAPKEGPDSPAARLASELASLVPERAQRAAHAVNTKLAEGERAIEASAETARARYRSALERYLVARDPPGAHSTLRLQLTARPKQPLFYEAEVTGRSESGLEWQLAVRLPDGSPWAKARRVEQVNGGLSVLTPQRSGLIKKEIKLKRHKLDRWLVTKLADDGTTVRVELRPDTASDEGLEVGVDLEQNLVSAARTGDTDDPTVGAFAVDAQDRAALVELATRLRESAVELPRDRLVSATLDDVPFDGTDADAQPRLVEIVSRLVAELAPLVREIAARSRNEEELVLRRVLADGHREEIFLAKETLRESLARLEGAHRELFAPLGLDAAATGAIPPSREQARATEREADPDPTLEVGEADMPSDAPAADAAASDALPPPESREARRASSAPPPGPPSDELVAALAHVRAMTEGGLLDEAHRQYATLFGSPSFVACPPEHQREALRLMLCAEPPPPRSDEVRAAHRAAVGALQALVLERRAPEDYELLGMAYLALEERQKATETFKKALDMERSRNPASDLYESLMRRVGPA